MFKLLILGVVQGLTEFLPVSSSGHLVILEKFFGIDKNQLILGVIFHFGTLLSLLVFFYKEIIKIISDFLGGLQLNFQKKSAKAAWQGSENFRLAVYILVVTAITGIIGIFGKDFFETLFNSVRTVSIALCATALILFKTKKYAKGDRGAKDLSFKDSLILGLSQGIAIIPGISRSGITISALMFRGIAREEAFRISFLASIPAVLGALLISLPEMGSVFVQYNFIYIFAGFMVSFLTGLLALKILKEIIKRASLVGFGYYCFFVVLLILVFNL